ncbi:MAG: hypothetical protein K6G56_08755 [Clostridiales bacterium]|nr:hypothetical protein [Clostridiales bacterium]
MRILVERIVIAAFMAALSEAALPQGRMGKCAKRIVSLIGTMMVIPPVIDLISEAL